MTVRRNKNGVYVRIVKQHGFKYYEFNLPKGAMYGYDDNGVFICMDYRVKGRTGFYHGMPRLRIYRPERGDIMRGSERRNCIKWAARVEASPTTARILDVFEQCEDLCAISWGNEARKIAKRMDLRPERDTVHFEQHTFMRDYPVTEIAVVVGRRTLEEIAAEQKGHAVFING